MLKPEHLKIYCNGSVSGSGRIAIGAELLLVATKEIDVNMRVRPLEVVANAKREAAQDLVEILYGDIADWLEIAMRQASACGHDESHTAIQGVADKMMKRIREIESAVGSAS